MLVPLVKRIRHQFVLADRNDSASRFSWRDEELLGPDALRGALMTSVAVVTNHERRLMLNRGKPRPLLCTALA